MTDPNTADPTKVDPADLELMIDMAVPPAEANPGATVPDKAGPGAVPPAVPVDPNKVVPEGTDPAIAAALGIVEERQRAVATIRQKIALAETALAEAIAREERAEFLAEFAQSDEIAQTAEARKLRVAAEEALGRLKMAIKGAQTALSEARGDHFRLNVQIIQARFQRLCTARVKAANALQSAAEKYGAALEQFERDNSKLAGAYAAAKLKIYPATMLMEQWRMALSFERNPHVFDKVKHMGVKLVIGCDGNLAACVAHGNSCVMHEVTTPPATDDADD